jgi:hypothetical protein
VTTFFMNEASFDLPDLGFTDRTITHLVDAVPGAPDVVMRVERWPLPVGKSLRQLAAELSATATKGLRDYKVLAEREGAGAGLPALDVAARWRTADGSPIYTRRLHVAQGSTWLVVVCEAPLSERDRCDANADRIAATLTIRSSS